MRRRANLKFLMLAHANLPSKWQCAHANLKMAMLAHANLEVSMSRITRALKPLKSGDLMYDIASKI
jgi:hypothetical protein